MYKCKVAGRITGNKLSGRSPIFSPEGGRVKQQKFAEVVRTVGRHARARIPSDVRVREGDYFVGSRAPQTQGR